VDRLNTPVDENNELDYEALEAINISMFNQHLSRLLEGDEVELPLYDFKTGSSGLSGQTIHLPAHELMIIEGIHGLNDRLSYLIDPKQKYRIYISAITQINLDNTNYTSTTDNRLMRRIIRDVRTRGVKSADTIKIWPSVRRGEENNIFPYQENADIMFNSSLVYELSVLKPFVEPQLRQISDGQEEFAEAQRLLKFLSFFVAAPSEHVPPNSILREFIGGSWFDVV
jgi:uridine kinase